MRRLIAATLLVASPALAASSPVKRKTKRAYCHHRLFTVSEARRAADVVYRGTRDVTLRNVRMLGQMERCQRNPAAQGYVRWYDRHQAQLHDQRLFRSAVASVYDAAGGPIACPGLSSYDNGVANLSLPCGTKLRICYSSCTDAVVFDRGPYVDGREFDLSRSVESAIGFPDEAGVATIRYSIR